MAILRSLQHVSRSLKKVEQLLSERFELRLHGMGGDLMINPTRQKVRHDEEEWQQKTYVE